jgi:hypothetical protein
MADMSEIIDDVVRKTNNLIVDAAVEIVELQLAMPDVIDSKIACDALKRAIGHIRSLRRTKEG